MSRRIAESTRQQKHNLLHTNSEEDVQSGRKK